MPLDSGGMNEVEHGASPDDFAPSANLGPTIHSGADVGQALRALREHRGMPLEALAESTRVRASYLTAIEEMQLDKLPSRPFVIGYIRAYAQALGADPDQAVERFKAEEPVLDEPLAAPVGVRDERDPRLAAIVAAGVVIIVAIVAWNVVQRVMTETAPSSPTASEGASAKALANTTAGPVALGAPLPPPVESTTPPPYETPGLSKAVNADGQPLVAQTAEAPPAAVDMHLAPTFKPAGQVYGAPSGALVLQALKPAFLVVRGNDGAIYFARQLAQGDAFRAPAMGGLTVDVSEPEAFQVFVGGQSHGVLPKPLSDVSGLLGATPAPAKPAGTAAAPKPAAAAPTTSKPATDKPATAKSATAKPASAGAKPTATTAKPPTSASASKPKPKPAGDAPKADPPF